MNVKIKDSYVDYILSENKFPSSFRERLKKSTPIRKGSFAHILLSKSEMEDLREIAMSLFLENGLDENQEPTSIGMILEDLIDLFYVK